MAEYKGIIAGIGEKVYDDLGNLVRADSTNVIYPKFDARIRQFIVGEDCVLYGLEADYELSAGACIIKGYVCMLEEPVAIGQSPTYIFAKLSLFDDENKEDEFSIVTSEEDLSVNNDDITNGVGTYYAKLYRSGIRQLPLAGYPKYAENSDTSENLSANGTIASTATVEGEIDPSDNSARVASTKFVHDVIGYDIPTKEIPIYLRGDGNHNQIGLLILRKRINVVTAQVKITSAGVLSTEEPIPKEFLPNGKGAFIYAMAYSDISNRLSIGYINSNGYIGDVEYKDQEDLFKESGWGTLETGSANVGYYYNDVYDGQYFITTSGWLVDE